MRISYAMLWSKIRHLAPNLNIAALEALELERGIGGGPAERPATPSLDASCVALDPFGFNHFVCTGICLPSGPTTGWTSATPPPPRTRRSTAAAAA